MTSTAPSSATPTSRRDSLRLATRQSPLALWQARRVAAMIERARPGSRVELVLCSSTGDENMRPFDEMFAKRSSAPTGLFTRMLDEALLAGRADIAVHSLKDCPTEGTPGLALACVPERAAVADVLVVDRARLDALRRDGAGHSAPATLRALAREGRIGTGSPRRKNQLLALLGDDAPLLRVASARGNVGTRLEKMLAGEFAAMVMAEAGLTRLSPEECQPLARVALVRFDPATELVPAPGQGALAVGRRADDLFAAEVLAAIHDPLASAEVVAERAFLAAMGGGCFVPFGALGRVDSATGRLTLRGRIAAESPEGSGRVSIREAEVAATNAEMPAALGWKLAAALGDEALPRHGRD